VACNDISHMFSQEKVGEVWAIGVEWAQFCSITHVLSTLHLFITQHTKNSLTALSQKPVLEIAVRPLAHDR
jgi:hypothetical protein